MQVGVQVILECYAIAPDELLYMFPFVSKTGSAVNYYTFFCLVPNKITVYLNGIHDKCFQFHIWLSVYVLMFLYLVENTRNIALAAILYALSYICTYTTFLSLKYSSEK